jgi:hypothetical protein
MMADDEHNRFIGDAASITRLGKFPRTEDRSSEADKAAALAQATILAQAAEDAADDEPDE